MDGPNAQAIARVDDAFTGDPRLIQERAVHAVEILDGEAAILKLEQAMAPAYFRRRDAQIAVPASADDGRLMAQLDFPTSSRTFIDNQLHVHRSLPDKFQEPISKNQFQKARSGRPILGLGLGTWIFVSGFPSSIAAFAALATENDLRKWRRKYWQKSDLQLGSGAFRPPGNAGVALDGGSGHR